MYLKKLHIKNFRCFSDYEIEFAPRVTVLFGKNGSGKSTLIHAMHKAVSFIFDKTIIKENKYNLGGSFGLNVEAYTHGDFPIDFKTGLRSSNLAIDAEGMFGGEPLPSWEIYANNSKTKSNKPTPSKYKEAYIELMKRIGASNNVPYVTYYSDSFPHIPKMKSLTKNDWALRELGYLDWNEESACSEVWISRLTNTWTLWDRADREYSRAEGALRNLEHMLESKVITQDEYDEGKALHTNRLETAKVDKAKYEPELDAIRKCLIEFTKGDTKCEITDFFKSVYDEEMCFQTTQGNNPLLHNLPAGYKRVLFMVLDIAYRSFILNKNTDAEGLVIIDEIDLHLHPELEQSVLGRFMKTFTKAQFVVSTHSPAVISNLPQSNDNRIVHLLHEGDRYDNVELENIYGLDYNLTVSLAMGASPRNSHVQMMKDRYVRMKRRDSDKVSLVVEELKKLFPETFDNVIAELDAKVKE